MRQLLFIALALTLPGFGASDTTSAQRRTKLNEEPIATIPFRYEGLMFTDVRINGGTYGYNFLIDSGASNSVMSTRLADLLELECFEAGEVSGVGTAKVSITLGVDLDVSGHQWKNRMIAVTDLSGMADVLGKHMDGILGADWMMQFGRCRFDFLDKQLACYPYRSATLAKRGIVDVLGDMGDLRDMFKGALKPAQGSDGIQGEVKELLKQLTDQLAPQGSHSREQLRSSLRALRDSIDDMLEMLDDEQAPDSGSEHDTDQHSDPDGEPFSFPSPACPLPFDPAPLIGQEPQDAAAAPPTALSFDLVEATVPLFGSAVLVSLWFTDIEINGRPMKVIFDTGAMPLLVIDHAEAGAIDLGHSYTVPVSGVGTSEGTMGLVESLRVGAYTDTTTNVAMSLDLQTTFSQLTSNPVLGALSWLGIVPEIPEPVGIVGLPFALNYRSMTVDHEQMTLSFAPYTADELSRRDIDPTVYKPTMIESVENAWRGEAGSLGFEANELGFESWEREGVEGGLVIETVRSGTGAQTAGLEPGDILYAIVPPEDEESASADNPEIEPLRGYSSAIMLAAGSKAGDTWTVMVKKKRTGKHERVSFALAPLHEKVRIPKRYEQRYGK